MFGFGSKRAGQSHLKDLLAAYPASTPPHLGHVLRLPGDPGPVLTPEQTRRNFLAFRDAIPTRISALRDILAQLDLDLDEAYVDATAFVLRLHRTLLLEMPPLYRPELADRLAWELSDRSGDEIVLSFLADCAILTGDVLIRAYPGVFWGRDLDPRDRTKFARCRPSLIGLGDRLFPNLPPSVFFLEEEWFGYYANMDDPTRLAGPDSPIGIFSPVIGGLLPERLERYQAHPDLARLRTEGWMKDAA